LSRKYKKSFGGINRQESPPWLWISNINCQQRAPQPSTLHIATTFGHHFIYTLSISLTTCT